MTLLIFILILSVLVFVHELGHFVAAKKAGILVEEFGFGLPPKLWGKKIGETLYSINALPIGGFVRLYGEDGSGEMTNDQLPMTNSKGRAYFDAPIWRRLTVLFAGVTMNLLLAIVSFSVLYYVSGIPTKTGKIAIVAVAENSPARLAEIKEGDEVVAIDGQEIFSIEQFVKDTKEKAGKEIQLQIFREKDSQALIVSLVPRESPPEGEGPLGVAVSDVELKKYPWWQMPYLGMVEGFKESLAWGKMILGTLKSTLVSLVVKGQVPKDIAGPIGIFQITGLVAKEGFLAILQFLGILSVNLAIINVLPFPALDGGRLLFLGYEIIFRKKAPPKVEVLVNQIGMTLLLALMVLITVNDVFRLIKK
ncbi:hypothetical protein COT64_01870 [Candidatus Shapirobacteria bacterium CG09_land_8_20_14_0_10_39_12]|uniref:PDZ domain-containing protein n=1 Tax=Candidatus Shapirobacteria bacterium CG09_land_8_20_14_0_10_39_12 TaxID=1974885 RepID=A0A2H0WRP2_9BACT|nr:MAG: hypothetical protein COT64_01870 [Candidatus Shapirobacteria bacterium CG09_land_8_20_14_0_10_39_12]